MTYLYVMLLITYSGDVKGIPVTKFGDPTACLEYQKQQEEFYKADFIALSACMVTGDRTIAIQIRPDGGNVAK